MKGVLCRKFGWLFQRVARPPTFFLLPDTLLPAGSLLEPIDALRAVCCRSRPEVALRRPHNVRVVGSRSLRSTLSTTVFAGDGALLSKRLFPLLWPATKRISTGACYPPFQTLCQSSFDQTCLATSNCQSRAYQAREESNVPS